MRKGRKWKKKRCPDCNKKTNHKHICSGKNKQQKRKNEIKSVNDFYDSEFYSI